MSSAKKHHLLGAVFFGELRDIAEHLDLYFSPVVNWRQFYLDSLYFVHFFWAFSSLWLLSMTYEWSKNCVISINNVMLTNVISLLGIYLEICFSGKDFYTWCLTAICWYVWRTPETLLVLFILLPYKDYLIQPPVER